jgi:hypothetical protein
MDVTPLIDDVRRDLARAAELGGEAGRATAERLLLALEPALRLMLMDALTRAAAEIDAALPTAEVSLRLIGREPVFVVEQAARAASPAPADDGEAEGDADAAARLTLRLPQSLKERAEALAARAGQSLNSWLVGAIRSAAAPPDEHGRHGFKGKRMQGWAR